jgi:hypothetical protein
MIGDRLVDEGELLTIMLSASDPDDDMLSFSMDNPPDGSELIMHGDGTAEFLWTPGFDQAGNLSVVFNVFDDGVPVESDSEEITITVGNVNRPPELDPIGNRPVTQGDLLVVLLTASDPDGDNLSYSTSNSLLGAELIDYGNGSAEFRWLPEFPQLGDFAVTFTVTDDGILPESDSEEIIVSVLESGGGGKSTKSQKSGKSDKSNKSGKSEKSNKSKKSGKSRK